MRERKNTVISGGQIVTTKAGAIWISVFYEWVEGNFICGASKHLCQTHSHLWTRIVFPHFSSHRDLPGALEISRGWLGCKQNANLHKGSFSCANVWEHHFELFALVPLDHILSLTCRHWGHFGCHFWPLKHDPLGYTLKMQVYGIPCKAPSINWLVRFGAAIGMNSWLLSIRIPSSGISTCTYKWCKILTSNILSR